MEPLIQVVNQIQDVFGKCGVGSWSLDLPQITVVGAQSSGKSSVMESIVGLDFLPRGTGVVTRRPILMQLIQVPKGTKPYAEFLHLPGKLFEDFNEVMAEIERDTQRVAGGNKMVNPKSINLKIYSPNVLDLTLVDLPGLTKVPVGDQPDDIEKLIRAMVYSFVEKKNALILAVHAANTDLATCDALQIARRVDPTGARTIGVVTKLDLMDEGTNALDVLTNKTIPLRHGYVGVVNRSQANIKANQALEVSRKEEEEFFAKHEAYSHIARHHGSRVLAKKLSQLLLQHIRETLPDIRNQLTTKLSQVHAELLSLGGWDDAASVLNGASNASLLFADGYFGSSSNGLGAASNSIGGRKSLDMDDISNSLKMRTASQQQHQTTKLLQLIAQFSVQFASYIDGTGAGLSSNSQSHVGPALAGSGSGAGVGIGLIPSRASSTVSAQASAAPQFSELSKPSSSSSSSSSSGHYSQLVGGAKIQYTFFDVFGGELNKMDALEQLTVEDMRAAIQNASGVRTTLFVSEDAFDGLASFQVQRFLAPALACVDQVYDQLREISALCLEAMSLKRFPSLSDALRDATENVLRTNKHITLKMVTALVHMHSAYINTKNADFQDAFRAQSQSVQSHTGSFYDTPSYNASSGIANGVAADGSTRSLHTPSTFPTYTAGTFGGSQSPHVSQRSNTISGSMTEREAQEIKLIRIALSCYFDNVKKTLQDSVPKAVMAFLVNTSKSSLQSELVNVLLRNYDVGDLMAESPEAIRRRAELTVLMKAINQALDVLRDVGTSSIQMD